jgi:hypothetical protein
MTHRTQVRDHWNMRYVAVALAVGGAAACVALPGGANAGTRSHWWLVGRAVESLEQLPSVCNGAPHPRRCVARVRAMGRPFGFNPLHDYYVLSVHCRGYGPGRRIKPQPPTNGLPPPKPPGGKYPLRYQQFRCWFRSKGYRPSRKPPPPLKPGYGRLVRVTLTTNGPPLDPDRRPGRITFTLSPVPG